MTSKESARPEGRRLSARARLLNTADDLFYRRGIRSVGVDEVIREAGVAKVSLYRAFPSKDDLIVAYLEQRHLTFWRTWDEALEGVSDPEAAFRAAMAFICRAIEDPAYKGCPFANFSVEFREHDHPARALVERSKQETRIRLASLMTARGTPDAEQVADALFLLIEGAFSVSQTSPDGARQVSDMLARSISILIPAPQSRSSKLATANKKRVDRASMSA